jgi:hypothetical protein
VPQTDDERGCHGRKAVHPTGGQAIEDTGYRRDVDIGHDLGSERPRVSGNIARSRTWMVNGDRDQAQSG